MNWESKILTRNPSGIHNLQSYSCDQRPAQIFKIHSLIHRTNDPFKLSKFTVLFIVATTHYKFTVQVMGPTTRSNFRNFMSKSYDQPPIQNLRSNSWDQRPAPILKIYSTIHETCDPFWYWHLKASAKLTLNFLWTCATKFGQNINGNQPTLMRSITWKTTFLIYFCYFLSLSDLKS